jgi:hypothetical protein
VPDLIDFFDLVSADFDFGTFVTRDDSFFPDLECAVFIEGVLVCFSDMLKVMLFETPAGVEWIEDECDAGERKKVLRGQGIVLLKEQKRQQHERGGSNDPSSDPGLSHAWPLRSIEQLVCKMVVLVEFHQNVLSYVLIKIEQYGDCLKLRA